MRLQISVLLAIGTLIIQANTETIPAFLWSSEPSLGTVGGNNMQTNFETINYAALLNTLTSTKQKDSGAAHAVQSIQNDKQLITILVKGQGTRSSLRQASGESSFLKSAMQSAASSVYLANIQGMDSAIPLQSLYLGSCGEAAGLSLDQLKAALKSSSGRLTVSVCQDVSVTETQELIDFASSSDLKYTVAYFGQPDYDLRPAARSLQAVGGVRASGKLCDEKCQAQVRLFETIILLVILLWALWIGMNMMHILDTPSRFETEKKDQTRHQD